MKPWVNGGYCTLSWEPTKVPKLFLRKTQHKTTMRSYFRTTRMLQIKKIATNNGKEVEKLKPSDIAGGNIKWQIQLFQKIFWQFLKKLNINLSFNSIPRYLPKRYPHKTCTQMFIATLFIIAPNWKQFTHQLVNGYTNCDISMLWNTVQQ